MTELTSEHKYPSNDELLEIPKDSYTCHICQFTVRTKSNLKAHIIKKHKIIEDDNDYAFLTKQKAGRKIFYHCPVTDCKYNRYENGFRRYFGLKQHYLWVHGDKPYMCESCKRTFPTAKIFRNHRTICGQLFYCNFCSKVFRSKASLVNHQKCHHADQLSTFSHPSIPPPPAHISNNDCKSDLSPRKDCNRSIFNYLTPQESPNSDKKMSLCVPFVLPSNDAPHSFLQPNDPTVVGSSIKGVASLVVSLCHYLSTVTNNQDVVQQSLRLQHMVNSLSGSSFSSSSSSSMCGTDLVSNFSYGSGVSHQSAINLSTNHSLDAGINVVPHVMGAGIQSCAPTIESSIQTDDWEAYIRSNSYPCEMPSVGVLTDLSLGLEESAVLQSILQNSDSSYQLENNHHASVSSVNNNTLGVSVNEHHYSTACGPSPPPYLSTTAMQTDKSDMYYPSTHVETQTWRNLFGQEIGLQDLTDIETQTVDIDELLAGV